MLCDRVHSDVDSTESTSDHDIEREKELCNGQKIHRLLAVERPSDKAQVYIASGLRLKYHFSCPTSFLPSLFQLVQRNSDGNLDLMFIPSSTSISKPNIGLSVINGIPVSDMINAECVKELPDIVCEVGSKGANSPSVTTMKRSQYSSSIGLQTMYSHQQHLARYSMLPHSKPHVVSGRVFPDLFTKSIISIYQKTNNLIRHAGMRHPFIIDESVIGNGHRYSVRRDLLESLVGNKDEVYTDIEEETMFESCTVQPTSALGYHKDLMNCPLKDKTIACLVPCQGNEHLLSTDGRCLSFLFYTRKCVGDYVQRMDSIDTYLSNSANCGLSRLCLKSLLHVGGVFDYQGSLFECRESLLTIANRLQDKKGYSCPDVREFTGLQCFKHGAAFDKMGYYSVFVNMFMTMHYKGFIQNVNDAISLCIYFGFMCNGTSILAALWHELHRYEEEALDFYQKKKKDIKLIRLLVTLERNRDKARKKMVKEGGNKEASVLHGNCKCPRFQYANYALSVIENAKSIHSEVKEFMSWRIDNGGGKKSVSTQHAHLYSKLKKFKGIGALSFNQFWHALCLCGIVPHNYIESSVIGPGSGPAKLIQTFYPSLKSPDALLKKLGDVKNTIASLGLKKVSEFFVENSMCEIWRLANRYKLLSKDMSIPKKCAVFLSSKLDGCIDDSEATRFPDLYFCNPFTGTYQHLFRVINKELVMRPSFLDNNLSSSSQVQCQVSYDTVSGLIGMTWKGDYLSYNKISPEELFVDAQN
jgi:hypothetical protein